MRTRRRNRNLLKQQRVKIHNHCCHRHPQTHQLRQLQPLAPSSSIATSIEEVEQQQFDTAPNIKDYTANPNQSQQEQLGIEDETFKTPLGLDISVSLDF